MLLVIAGLPGAGKTTLADQLGDEVPVLDSDRVRRRWEVRMRWLPYAVWRPVVHLAHWVAILPVLQRGEPAILVRPFTTGWSRRLVLRCARGPAHLIALTASADDEARHGQRRRGRTVSDGAMRRHESAWTRADVAGEGWASVTRLSRAEAAQLSSGGQACSPSGYSRALSSSLISRVLAGSAARRRRARARRRPCR